MDALLVQRVNDTYVKIICETSIARELNDFFQYHVPNYWHSPAYKDKLWDGKIRLFSLLTRQIYYGLIPRIHKFALDRGYDIVYNSILHNESFSLKEAHDYYKSLDLSEEIDLRDYQLQTFATGIRSRRRVFICPTASGKSFIIHLLNQYLNKKTLIVVPTTSLVKQMNTDFIEYSKGSIPENKLMN